MTRIGIVGATGYTGAELLRILAAHPQAEIAAVTSRQADGQRVDEVFPQLRGHVNARFQRPDSGALSDCEIVFTATPHGAAMVLAPELLRAGVRLIDLSADFRLRDPAVFEQWYGQRHASPDLLGEAVYGLPERYRAALGDARLVAAPGCYPTAVQLGLMPLLEDGACDTRGLIADCKSGVSGAGREARVGSLFSEVADSFKSYAAGGHRHHPEIVQELAAMAGGDVELCFVPHLVPMVRGIHATLYGRLTGNADPQALFEARYRDEAFIDVLPPGSHPETRSVRASNHCRIAIHRPGNGERVVVLAAIDNLVKGAAGQAVQCMNTMLGLPETAGLMQLPTAP